jgi:uncharacterized membrane protein
MNYGLIEQIKSQLGANGLPYAIPIHPNLVHLTLGLFIVAVTFDIVGAFYVLEKPVFKFLAIPTTRASLFDVGWYNMLAQPSAEIKSAWGLQAFETMLWHGVGGVVLLTLIVVMTVWRGFQRYVWRKDRGQQVQWSYLAVGLVIMFMMYLHGTLGAHLAGEFGVHNTAVRLLRMSEDVNAVLK